MGHPPDSLQPCYGQTEFRSNSDVDQAEPQISPLEICGFFFIGGRRLGVVLVCA